MNRNIGLALFGLLAVLPTFAQATLTSTVTDMAGDLNEGILTVFAALTVVIVTGLGIGYAWRKMRAAARA